MLRNIFWCIRILLFYCIASIVTVICFLVLRVIHCIPGVKYYYKYRLATVFSYIFIYLLWLICGISYEVIDKHLLVKENGPFLVLSNHQSFWENIFLQLIIPEHSWVVKQELFDIPIFGWGLKIMDPIAVNRDDSRSVVGILKKGQEKLALGLSLIMFPEATRICVHQSTSFKPSAAKLAINAGVPIILIAHNAGVFWPKGFWLKNSGTIQVKILEIITPDTILRHNTRSLTAYIEATINNEKDLLAARAVETSNLACSQ